MPIRGFQCAIDVRVSTIVVAFNDRTALEAVYCVCRTAILFWTNLLNIFINEFIQSKNVENDENSIHYN